MDLSSRAVYRNNLLVVAHTFDDYWRRESGVWSNSEPRLCPTEEVALSFVGAILSPSPSRQPLPDDGETHTQPRPRLVHHPPTVELAALSELGLESGCPTPAHPTDDRPRGPSQLSPLARQPELTRTTLVAGYGAPV